MVAAAVLVVVSLLVAAVAPGAVAGGLVAGSSGGGNSDAVDPRPSPDDDAVAPGLRSANGTVEVVVRFAGDARLGADGGGAVESEDSATLSTTDLKSNAANAQADFETFAERKPGVAVEQSFWLANAMLVTVDTESVAIERLLDVRGVERVHGNFEVELDSAAAAESGNTPQIGAPGPAAGPTSTASATGTNATYGVEMVRAPEVWETFGTRGEGATVAVFDTGIDPEHPDLNVSGWAEYDANGNLVSEGPEDAYDDDGHGTHVAGTVAGGNTSGTAIGVAPESDLYGIKVLDDTGSGTFLQVVAGMEHATENEGIDVLQLSLGGDGQADEFIEPIQNARSAGKIVVASSGNSGSGTSSSPGNVYESFAVGAVDQNAEVAYFSGGETLNTSEDWTKDALTSDWPDEYVVPDASAPGVSVNSSTAGGGYRTLSGTSMAAPHVSGVAALMLSASTREVSDDELSDTLRDTADHPEDATEPDTRYGTGVVDGFEAVSSVTSAEFAVSEFDAAAETDPGATVEAAATVTNIGDGPGTATVEYRFNETVGNDTTVSLDPGESTLVSFTYVVPDETDPAEYAHGVYTEDSNQTSTITVRKPPSYAVANLSATDTAELGGPLNATVNVTNDGEVAGDNRTVELKLADPANASNVSVLAAENVSLGPRNATTLSLTGTVPSEFGTGETTATVASPEGEASASIRIGEAVGTVNGTVTDAETNDTLADMDVVVRNGTEVVGTTETGAEGSYAVDVPATELTVTASNATYAPANRTVALSGPGDAATANLSLALRNGTLSGVVNASDGLARPSNATVTVTNETDVAVATADAAGDGAYSVGLRPGSYNVTADAPDFEHRTRADIDISPNVTTNEDLALPPRPGSLSGVVTNRTDGEAVPSATVTVGGDRTDATDANGTYALDALDRGEQEITVSADGYSEERRTLTLTANDSRELNVSLSPRGVFAVTNLSGESEIEQGSSGGFAVTVRNDGRVTDDATVDVALNRSGSVSPTPVVIDDVAVGDTGSNSFSVSLGSGASTGTYAVTASTPDGEETVTFVGVSGEDGGTDDGGGDDGGGGGGGDGGGGGGGAQPSPPAGDTDDEPEDETDDSTNETDDATNETDDSTNATDDLTNETGDPTNATDDLTNETGDPTNATDDLTNKTDKPVNATDDTTGGEGESVDDGRADGDGETDAEDVDAGDDDTADGGGSTDGAPGFGLAVGLLAVLAATLLAGRRGERGGRG
ncbi:peptidase S8/S53 subtilisin kexin sedolisin [Halorubrum kocurii JCM 14978]|uniref:Peptidase S8/S53 subtilisin kexin sedolisin n=1 Tax=Halorubrum kocurii JCM 14978 TaxID=1230456 RepID=M0P4B7_9EURY|nr:peptidase S8/S53 subtilisin kexin sedolisin [Halorubrum kocurii JCM 14978]